MTDTTDRIKRYYAPDPAKEWRRLSVPDGGPIEFELTKRHIARHLAPGSRVLDIGGGPGRYTVWLAEQGHRVVLADLVPELLVEAREQIRASGASENVEQVVAADVCDLSQWAAAAFDAAICLGPFYHLPEPGRRQTAGRELARVIRPGGLLVAAFMPRLGFLRRTMSVREEWPHLANAEFVRAIIEDGTFLNDNPGRFDAGYGARPEEIGPFFERLGFETATLVAAEGFAPAATAELEEMRSGNPESYAAALDVLEATSDEPSILGASNHLLYIGRKL